MTYDFLNDIFFREIADDVTLSNGVLRDAWVPYKNENWNPVLIRDQKSGILGIEVNLSGKWGTSDEVGRKKFRLEEFLQKLADGSIPLSATIRCKCGVDSQRNGRKMAELQLSSRLQSLVEGIRATL